MPTNLILLLFNGLSPIIPAIILIGIKPSLTTITPWPVVGALLVINLFFVLFAWKKIGYTQHRRVTEAAMILVNAFIPLVTYSWLFPTCNEPISLLMQVFLYCLGQTIWVVSTQIGPDWVGNIRQKKAEERALSGKQKFDSRDEVIRNHKK